MDNQLIWIRDLRVIATISVIVLHVSKSLLSGNIINYNWWVGNIFDSSVRFCVPIFLMISGTLLLPKEYELDIFFKKKTLRIIYPFLFWSIFYNIFLLIRISFHGETYNLFHSFKFIAKNILFGSEFSYHLWYIYMLIGLYLFIPIIGKWVRKATNKEIEYFLIIWCLINVLSLTKVGNEIIHKFNLNYFSGYLGYLILGYYLSRKKFNLKIKLMQWFSLLIFLIGVLITTFGEWILSFYKGEFIYAFYDYLTPNVLLISIGVFLFFKNTRSFNSNSLIRIRNIIDNHSYGIYLVHIFVLECFFKFRVDLHFWSIEGKFPILGIILTTIFCLSSSFVIVYLVNILPFGKYISGVTNSENKFKKIKDKVCINPILKL
jgi:surface polysaccharide O-acyltransferase-like enzyme